MTPAPIVKTAKRGSLYIHIRKYADGRYGFDRKPDDYSREKIRLNDLDSAIERAESMLGMGHAGKADLMGINPDELGEFLRWKAAQRTTVNTPSIVKQFLDEKSVLEVKGELSYSHVKDLKGTLEEFAKAFLGKLDGIDRKAAEKWLNDQNIGPRSFNNRRAHLVALVRYARSHRWIGTDVTPIEEIPKRKVRAKKETYTPEELTRILHAVPFEWRPAVVLGAFCGLRPEEICPDFKSQKPAIRWENFLWHKKKIDMPAEVAKDGRRRFVPLCDTAIEWLSHWQHSKGRTVPRLRMDNRTRMWARDAKLERWRHDALRHSYASYRLAKTNDLAALSLEMGNSAKMIHDHYLDLKHAEEADEWFSLTPKKLGISDTPENVIQFETA